VFFLVAASEEMRMFCQIKAYETGLYGDKKFKFLSPLLDFPINKFSLFSV